MKRKKALIAVTLIPVLLVAAAIFLFSSQNAEESGELSAGVTEWVLSLFVDVSELSPGEWEALLAGSQNVIRKTAHVLEYAAFGFFLVLHLSTWMNKRPWLAGLTVSLLYSGSDELHQYFVGGRAMQLRDMGFDLFGAALGIGAYTLLACLIRRLSAGKQMDDTRRETAPEA